MALVPPLTAESNDASSDPTTDPGRCSHHYVWVWKGGARDAANLHGVPSIWTDDQVCTTCGDVRKAGAEQAS